MATNTFEFFSRYCEQKFPDETRRNKVYNALARNELLEEEARLGKGFFEFTEDEIEQYLLNLSNNGYYKGKNIRPSQTYIRILVSYYRSAFQFYNEETGRNWNPMRDDRFRHIGSRVKNNLPIFTRETLENICLSIGEHFEKGDSEFMQLMLWLYYSGCFDADEIIGIKREDIDFEKQTVDISGRTIHLQDECIELFEANQKIDEFKAHKLTNLMLPYHGSYVRFPYRMSKTPDGSDPYEYAYQQQQERSPLRIKDIMSKRLAKIRSELGVFIQPTTLYYRGIYDYIVSQCGRAHASEIIWSETNRNTIENAEEFNNYLREYGAKVTDNSEIYKIKGNLRAFLS